MSMVRCNANKHFYDSDVHVHCPYCTSAYDVDLGGLNNSLDADLIDRHTAPIVDFNERTEIMDNSNLANGGYTNTVQAYENDATVMLGSQPSQEKIELTSDNDVVLSRRDPIKTRVYAFGNAVKKDVYGEKIVVNTTSIHKDLNNLPVTGWLVVIDGPGLGLDFRLIQGENRIGRDREMEICLDFGDISDDMVSRDSHAIVVYDNYANVFFVERGRSRNMPLLNGRTIRSNEDLKSGDIIQVGQTKLMLISFCNELFKWS